MHFSGVSWPYPIIAWWLIQMIPMVTKEVTYAA